jgi:hypothetical protein
MREKFKTATLTMLAMAFSITELMFYNAEQIFFGCLLAARTDKDIKVEWILAQTIFK